MIQKISIRKNIYSHLIISVGMIALGFVPSLQLLQREMLIGTLLSFFNFALISWALKNIFLKKNIALSVSVIVFKWPILGYLLYILLRNKQLHVGGLAIGGSSLVLAVVLLAVWDHLFNKTTGTPAPSL